MRILFASLLVVCSAAGVVLAQAPPAEFDAATIKLMPPLPVGTPLSRIILAAYRNGTLTMESVTLSEALRFAYDLTSEDQVSGPDWIKSRGTRYEVSAAQATRSEPNLCETQHVLGQVSWQLEWDWPNAEAAFRRAVALDASSGWPQSMLGHLLSQTGRHAEAVPFMRRARELDPFSAAHHAMSSQVAFQARDYTAASEHARQAIVIDPDFWVGYMMRGQASDQLGETDVALEALAIAARLSGGNSKPISLRGYVLARIGMLKDARDVLGMLGDVARSRYVPPYAMALVHAGLGEPDAVFEWLDRAYAVRDVHLVFLTVDPKWDSYRVASRFAVLLERCGFAQTTASGTPH